ncbi:MAG: hypothetical protein Q8R38_05680 [Candidatus Omnitrophota bacterium]|nr:hypothetical protein [Candidatus Omnitrophota bacterium]
MIIAFSGIDGSGKTTAAEFVLDYLRKRNITAEYSHIIRDSFYHKILHKVIGKVSKNAQRSLEENLRKKKGGISIFISKCMKKMVLFINLLCFNLQYHRYKNNIQHNIVTDRYFYDDIVQGVYLGIMRKGFLVMFKKCIIQPDIVFFLRSEPALAYDRKREYDKEYFIVKSVLYDDMYRAVPNVRIAEGSMDNIKGVVKNYLEKAIGKYV